MSRVFTDTSALYALLVSSDENHDSASRTFRHLEERGSALLCSSYVLVETYALLGARVGRGAVAAFRADFAPLLQVVRVDAPLHERGLDLLLSRDWKGLSLVDAVSFEVMRDEEIEEAFAFDRHFGREGFTVL